MNSYSPSGGDEKFDRLRRQMLDLSNNAKGTAPKWLAEALSDICDELGILRRRISDLETNRDIFEGLRILENRLTPESLVPAQGAAAPDAVTVTANELWDPANGFYELEWTGNGVPFRWTGPHRTFRFVLRVNRRKPLDVVLNVLPTPAGFEMPEVLCRIDGKIEALRVESSQYANELHAVAPARPDASKIVAEFELSGMQAANPPDVRTLGIAVNSFRAEPSR